MKRFSIIMMCVATMAMSLVSCGSLSSTSTSSSNPAMDNGKSTSSALVALYNSYKSNGSISMTNPTDLSNMITLVAQYKQMKSNKGDAEYMKSFAAGMVASGSGLITSGNVETIIAKLNSITGLNADSSKIASDVATINAIVQLVQMLK